MSTVVVESLLTGGREEIEVGLEKGIYSTFTFRVTEMIGIIPEVYRINGQIGYFCKALIYPRGDNRPPIATCVRLVDSIDGVDGTLVSPVFVEVVDPFSTPWETYLRLPPLAAERLKERVWDENEEWIREQIESRGADWILVCNRDVIKWSDDRKEYPSEEELEKIAKEYNLFPFVFVQPPLIEETSWNPTRYKRDYYPTIKISVCGEMDLIGDFDTGNPITTLNRDELTSSGYLQPRPFTALQKWRFLDEEYYYSSEPIHIQIADELGNKQSKDIRCDCVKDWRESPFCKVNPCRQALVGRDILLEFPLEVRLDGKGKKTYIYLRA